jgi:hypothetical protein
MENNIENQILSDKKKKFIKNMADCVYYCKKFNELNEMFQLDTSKKERTFKDINCYIYCYNLLK